MMYQSIRHEKNEYHETMVNVQNFLVLLFIRLCRKNLFGRPDDLGQASRQTENDQSDSRSISGELSGVVSAVGQVRVDSSSPEIEGLDTIKMYSILFSVSTFLSSRVMCVTKFQNVLVRCSGTQHRISIICIVAGRTS